ncbi:hypothetical protein [Burkholderia sp. HI2500]|uniref:hypothetical protein n=1 Tax=Burkholderia sp. HI2500 TaxID=2015358 RepID=UPI00117FCFEE|nr:hypothetical protein [Burkholderia sp. HI2500]
MSLKSGMSDAAMWIVMIVVFGAAFKGCSALESRAGISSWIERNITCKYKNASGDCLTEDEHFRLVAHDAAVDALTDMLNFCSGPAFGARFDPSCVALRKAVSQAAN